ncbi:MAG: hypothetical protein AAFV53_14330 [Myxococcota bacterium]
MATDLKPDKKTVTALKQIIKGNGKIQGYFYFAGDKSAANAALVVRTAKGGDNDPAASKVASEGKKLRKAIPNAKFARGKLVGKSSAPIFELHGGNADKGLLKKAFKTNLSTLDGLRFLKAAAFVAKGATDEAPELDTAALSEEEQQAIAADLEMNEEELQAFTAEAEAGIKALDAAFLDADEEMEEILQEKLQKIAELESGPRPLSEEAAQAVQEARYELAEQTYVGSDPFPEIGAPLDAQSIRLLEAAITNAVQILERQITKTRDEIAESHKRVLSMSPEQQVAFAAAEVGRLRGHQNALRDYRVQIQNLQTQL